MEWRASFYLIEDFSNSLAVGRGPSKLRPFFFEGLGAWVGWYKHCAEYVRARVSPLNFPELFILPCRCPLNPLRAFMARPARVGVARSPTPSIVAQVITLSGFLFYQ